MKVGDKIYTPRFCTVKSLDMYHMVFAAYKKMNRQREFMEDKHLK